MCILFGAILQSSQEHWSSQVLRLYGCTCMWSKAKYIACTNKNSKILAEMGSAKNKNSNVSRGKFKKRAVPQRWQTKKTAHGLQEGETKSPLEGSRIINLAQLAAFIRKISEHSASCQQGTIMLTGKRNRCSVQRLCCLEVAIPTSKVSGVVAGQRWECNLAAVWGQMSLEGDGDTPRWLRPCPCWGCQWWPISPSWPPRRLLDGHGGRHLRRAWRRLQRKRRGPR